MMQGKKGKDKARVCEGRTPQDLVQIEVVSHAQWKCYVLSKTVMERNTMKDKLGDQELLVMIWTNGDCGWIQSRGSGGRDTWTVPRHILQVEWTELRDRADETDVKRKQCHTQPDYQAANAMQMLYHKPARN